MNTSLPLNLLKENFHDVMVNMRGTPGWEIFEEGTLLALKSPSHVNFINLVWGEASLSNIKKIQTFFYGHHFNWVLTSNQNSKHLLDAGFEEPQLSPEMVLNLKTYQLKETNKNIKVIQVKTANEFNAWTEIISETFKLKKTDIKAFFHPLIYIAGDIPYLTYYKDLPVGTSLVYCSSQVAAIGVVSTLEKYRSKGIGFAATQACIKHAQKLGLPYAVLYSSSLGQFLYSKMGFKTAQVLQEFSSAKLVN
jgi:GNAT superfamily N-acetyltransferase